MNKIGLILICVMFSTFSFKGMAQDTINVLVPNVFTPNKDGVNDVFRPTYSNVKSVNGYIYNRWGEIIYQWWGLNGYWDGVTMPAGIEVPEGTYYYVIRAYSLTDEELVKKGSITLKR